MRDRLSAVLAAAVAMLVAGGCATAPAPVTPEPVVEAPVAEIATGTIVAWGLLGLTAAVMAFAEP